jgi:brefeldin A-inhibited guanine nucleotide-exchange protein
MNLPLAEAPSDDDASMLHNSQSPPVSSGAPGRPAPKMDKFEEQKHIKLNFESGKLIFNQKAKKGIKYLVDHGHITMTPPSVAKFLYDNHDLLNKVQIGQYLGEADEFTKQVLYCFGDCFNLKGMELDAALRYFVSTFRLPGEAKQVDRIMLKFAERYFKDNPDTTLWNCSDAPYVLSFSIVMLATDLHAEAQKVKMTKQEWIKSNRLLVDLKDVPDAYFNEMYASNRVLFCRFPLSSPSA